MTLGFGIIPKEIGATSNVEIETETTDVSVSVSAEGGCDEGACRTGFALGMAASCGVSASAGAVGAVGCTVEAAVTFGLSCVLSLATIGISTALCNGLPAVGDQGETF